MIIDLTSLRIVNQNFSLRFNHQSAGVGLDNREQIVVRENSIWECRIDSAPLVREFARQAQAWGDDARGRAGSFLIKICNYGAPKDNADPNQFYGDLGFSSTDIANGYSQYSDGTKFTDGTGFDLPAGGNPVLMKAASAGASSITLKGALGSQLKPGNMFSHNNFAYRVAENHGGAVRFNPQLRGEIAAGDVIEVIEPKVIMALQSDSGWSQFVRHGRYTQSLSLTFEEVFDR